MFAMRGFWCKSWSKPLPLMQFERGVQAGNCQINLCLLKGCPRALRLTAASCTSCYLRLNYKTFTWKGNKLRAQVTWTCELAMMAVVDVASRPSAVGLNQFSPHQQMFKLFPHITLAAVVVNGKSCFDLCLVVCQLLVVGKQNKQYKHFAQSKCNQGRFC